MFDELEEFQKYMVFTVHNGKWGKGFLKASLLVPRDVVLHFLSGMKEGEKREIRAILVIDRYLEKKFGWVKVMRVRCPKCSYPGWLRLRIRYGLEGNSADVYVDHGRLKKPRMCYINISLFDELDEAAREAAREAAKNQGAYLYSYLYYGGGDLYGSAGAEENISED